MKGRACLHKMLPTSQAMPGAVSWSPSRQGVGGQDTRQGPGSLRTPPGIRREPRGLFPGGAGATRGHMQHLPSQPRFRKRFDFTEKLHSSGVLRVGKQSPDQLRL